MSDKTDRKEMSMEEGRIGQVSAEGMGRATYRFVRRVMRNPEFRKKIKELAAQLEAAERKENAE
jgi:hypothetical protein